ncbi:hypothetical protein EKG38_11125 [Shewanella canadensis]|uniref:DUF1236 domain-containing protein n=1 Tax=Shewanella canadensis TaxID=271096 RepID=A0A3S0KVQ0_9GAMM|nr:hypothetical protein [Shewanella canadensis]RTR38719.1 hypothetical protein EKG38_11125 [Shewanella canadensis]
MSTLTTIRNAILLLTLTGATGSVMAHPNHVVPAKASPYKASVHVKKVVVKPGHRPVHKAPKHRSYHHKHLPASASFIVISGISYAIVDNAYYKRNGDQYIYIQQPPVTVQTSVNEASMELTSESITGSIVDLLPANTTTVTVNGVTFYVDGSDWYAPIAGTPRFVIVEPQL